MISLDAATNTLQQSLKSNTSWFTGIAIKNLWNTSIFSHYPYKSNKIQTGQWSAYAHLSVPLALANLLKRCCVPGASIAADPFLTTSYPDAFQEYITQVYDVDRNTLAPTAHLQPCDLLVLYSQTGNIKQLQSIIEGAGDQKILLIIHSAYITHNLTQLCSLIHNGGVIFISTHNPLQKTLESLTKTTLHPTPFVLSFFLEDTITMSLEYHLSESLDTAKLNLDALYTLLSTQQKNTFTSLLNQQLQKTLYGVGKTVTNPKQVSLNEVWETILTAPLPDPLIQLLLNDADAKTLFITNESIASERLNTVYHFLLSSLPSVPEGTLMIPHVDTAQIYTRLLFFTTEKEKWQNEIQQLGFAKPQALTQTGLQLPNIRFIEKYGLLVELI